MTLFVSIVTLFVSIVIFSEMQLLNSQFDKSCTNDFLAITTSQSFDFFPIVALSRNCDLICINFDFLIIATLNLAIVTFSELRL